MPLAATYSTASTITTGMDWHRPPLNPPPPSPPPPARAQLLKLLGSRSLEDLIGRSVKRASALGQPPGNALGGVHPVLWQCAGPSNVESTVLPAEGGGAAGGDRRSGAAGGGAVGGTGGDTVAAGRSAPPAAQGGSTREGGAALTSSSSAMELSTKPRVLVPGVRAASRGRPAALYNHRKSATPHGHLIFGVSA